MDIKIGTIGKAILLNNPFNSKSTPKEYTGIIVSKCLNQDYIYYTMVTSIGTTLGFKESQIVSFKSTRLDPKVRDTFNEVLRVYKKVQKEKDKLKEQQAAIYEAELELSKTKSTLIDIQGIITKETFLRELKKAFPFEQKDWEVDFTPGSCVCYNANQNVLYFYKEKQVLDNYSGKYSSLMYEEYDGNWFMVDDYEKLEEFTKYKNKYEEKFFPTLSVESLCFCGGKNALYFKYFQSLDLGEETLTKDKLEKTIKILKNS